MPQFSGWDGGWDIPSDYRDHRQYNETGADILPGPEAGGEAPVPDFGTWEPPSYHGSSSPTFNFGDVPEYHASRFNAPSFEDAQNDPGYRFRLDAGTQALNRSAAARGVLRTGGTLKDIAEYGQNFGAQEYKSVWDRAMQGYQANENANRAEYAPLLAQYQNQFQAEMARGQSAFDREYQIYNSDLQAQMAREQMLNQNLQFPGPMAPTYPG